MVRGTGTKGKYSACLLSGLTFRQRGWILCKIILLVVYGFNAASGAPNAASQRKPSDSVGFVVDLAATQADVIEVVHRVAQDPVIRGTFIYNKEKTLTGATPAESSSYFGPGPQFGQVFYKVLDRALAPRHFRNSNDIGTITVRYVVQSVNERNARLRIDAVFVQDGSRKVNKSDGSVEASEGREIQDQLLKIHLAMESK